MGSPYEPQQEFYCAIGAAHWVARCLQDGVYVSFDVEVPDGFVLAQVQGMMGVPLLAHLSGADPARVVGFADVYHVPDAVGEVVPLLDNVPPGGPHRGLLGQL